MSNPTQFVRLRASLSYTHANLLNVTTSNHKQPIHHPNLSTPRVTISMHQNQLSWFGVCLRLEVCYSQGRMFNTSIEAHIFKCGEVECSGFEHRHQGSNIKLCINYELSIPAELSSHNYFILIFTINVSAAKYLSFVVVSIKEFLQF